MKIPSINLINYLENLLKRKSVTVIAIATLAFLVLTPVDQTKPKDLVFGRICDAGHFPLFLLFTVVTYFALPKYNTGKGIWAYLTTGIFNTFLVIIIEIIQPLLDRSQSTVDLINGLLGVISGLILIYITQKQLKLSIYIAYFLGNLLLLLILLVPAYQQWEAKNLREQLFPQLANFEEEMELRLWPGYGRKKHSAITSLSAEFVSLGKYALKFELPGTSLSGVEYNAGDLSWENFSMLTFDIYNPGEASSLGIRIDDNQDCKEVDDRFNKVINLVTEKNSIQIPLEEIKHGPKHRLLNLTRIRRMLIFDHLQNGSRVYYLDNVKLNK